MSVGFQAYDKDGNLLFDSNTHRLIKFDKQVTNLTWNAVGGSNNIWQANIPGIKGTTHTATVNVGRYCFIGDGFIRVYTWTGISYKPPLNSIVTLHRF